MLALGTGVGSHAVSIISSFFTGALILYGLLRHREVLDRIKRIRRNDADETVYNEPDQMLSDLYKAQPPRAKTDLAQAISNARQKITALRRD